jgi:hypothetical protein
MFSNAFARNVIVYELRAVFGIGSLLPLLLPPCAACISIVNRLAYDVTPTTAEMARTLEFGLPLASALAASHLMSAEREAGFDELRNTYPERIWRVPLLRSALLIVLALVSAVVTVAIYRIVGGAAYEDMLPMLPPTLFLAALALLVNRASGSYWLAAAVIIAYWIGDYLSAGQYSGTFYLFAATAPNGKVDYLMNRLTLTTAAIGMCAAVALWRGVRRGR